MLDSEPRGCSVETMLGTTEGGLLKGDTLGGKCAVVGRLEGSSDGASEGCSVTFVLENATGMNDGDSEDTVGAMLDGVTLGCSVGVLLGDTVGAMLDGVTLGCSIGVLLGDTVGARLDGVTLGCSVGVLLGDTVEGTSEGYNVGGSWYITATAEVVVTWIAVADLVAVEL